MQENHDSKNFELEIEDIAAIRGDSGEAVWPFERSMDLYVRIVDESDRNQSRDVSSLPWGSEKNTLIQDMFRRQNILDAMRAKVTPHIDTRAVASEAEDFLRGV